MKKILPTLLTAMVWPALYSQLAHADLAAQCLLGVPQFDQPLISGDPDSLPVNIDSDKSDVNYPNNAIFQGSVSIKQGNRTLLANQAELEQTSVRGKPGPIRTITATGDVRYSDNQIRLNGPKAWSNLNNKDTDVYQGQYQMVGRQGRGTADKMKIRNNNRYTILDNGTFTSCLPGDNSWSVVGSEVIHDRDEDVAEIWNARVKLGSVPIFYSPYLLLPVGDKRRSGFLIPYTNYSNINGFEFALPYYWNIAPNYDATLTPHYITRRGLQWQNEFRYLTAPGAGVIALDWLPHDNMYQDKSPENNSRWLFYWGHNGVLDQTWRFNIDYTKVSDPYYFNDLDTVHGSSTDGYATQKFSLGYAQQNWNATIAMKKFQIFTLGGGNQNAYRAEPEFNLNYYQHDVGPFDVHLYSQVAKFISQNSDNPKTTRWHLEPAIKLPLANQWGSLNNEIKVMATHYQQDRPDHLKTLLDASVSRVLPQFKMDGTIVLDRPISLLKGYTQTLEPRVQYLYIPHKDQSKIGIYDTTLLQTDYSGLFRDRTFSGLDRIASANQLTTGITSRIYDTNLNERFNVSVGQIYHFSQLRTGLAKDDPQSSLNQSSDTGSLVWAADMYWKINSQWGLRGGMQYDTWIGSLTLANGILEYRRDQDRVIQLNYRYADSEYITAMLPRSNFPLYEQGISQIGMIGSWPVADRWSLVGAYYHDTQRQQPADTMFGVQYNTCCWAIRFGYERKINQWNNTLRASQYDNKYSFNIELRGLGGSNSLGSGDMRRSGILPYQRAF